MSHLYAEAMIAAGKYDEADAYLRDQAQLYREEPEVFDYLAQVYSKQGKIALQHIALAESYMLQGGTLSALEQLGFARKASDASFYDQALIDARERDWQARQREAMGDKAKKDLALQPAFKAELRGGSSASGSNGTGSTSSASGLGTSADREWTDPSGRLRQSTDPFERLRQKSDFDSLTR